MFFFIYCRVQLENRVLLGPQALKDPRYEGINIYVSGKLPTYLSPKPTITLTYQLGQNVALGEG